MSNAGAAAGVWTGFDLAGEDRTAVAQSEIRNAPHANRDDLSREVYCILGMPIDAVEIPDVLHKIEIAAARRQPFVISTPNLNFLVSSQRDPAFRESLLLSDLCTADGIPIVWIARLTGVPIKRRAAGSDVFEQLKTEHRSARPLKVMLFGGGEGVASAASDMINGSRGGLTCVGAMSPGFGSIDELSRGEFIDEINASGADFLVVSLGAAKGQSWLRRNHHRLRVPIRAHLGAVLNYQAGTVKRAPALLRKLGLEWLWRIKEEPYLWRRYWHDGTVLLRLLLTQVLPLVREARVARRKRRAGDLHVEQIHQDESVVLRLRGAASAPHA